MIVVDASIAVRILSREAGADAALDRLAGEDGRCAPDWIRLEVANGMARKVRDGSISAEDAMAAASGVTTLVETQYDSFGLLDDAFRLSTQIGHAMYDCLYLAAGVRHGVPVLTADRRFAAQASQSGFASLVELLA